MEVRRGYKQTELGTIPNDWELIKLGDAFNFKNGLNKEKRFFGQGTPIVNYMDVYKFRGLLSKDIIGKVTLSVQEIENYNVKKGDVFFTRTSETVEEIGISSVMLENIKDAVFSGFVLRARPYNNKLDIQFKKYCFSSATVRKEIVSKSSYTTRALTNGRLLANAKIAIPISLTEQALIATALSDTDSLIATLEKLIAKKRNIKQGAMQKLLSPKDGWVVKKLGEMAHVVMGQSPDSKFYNTERIGLPLIQGNADVANRKTIIRSYTSEITKRGRKGDIIMSVRAPVGEISVATFDCCLGRGVCSISYSNNYLYHYLIHFEKSWSKISTGSTFDSVNSKEVSALEIPIPKLEEEQIRIATILSDMEAEISALDAKLDKYKKIKQGMMQNLLTGKIRLV